MGTIKVADSARLVGSMTMGDRVYVAQGAVLRSAGGSLIVGSESMILENSVIISTPEHPVQIGRKTVFGHKCLVVGACIGDLCEVGNGSILLPGSRVGNLCIFGEGTLVPPGAAIPDESVVVGRPGQVIRRLSEGDREMIARMRGGSLQPGLVSANNFEFEPKEGESMGKSYAFGDKIPVVDGSAYLFDTAEITGDVVIGRNSIVAAGVKIIGDSHGPVRIGSDVQILENTVLHLLPDNQLIIEDHVTIGPGCIIHGTTIGSHSVIEAGAIVCDYSVLGKNTLVKSGSLVKQRSVIPDNQVLEGFPARVTGENKATLDRPAWAFRGRESRG